MTKSKSVMRAQEVDEFANNVYSDTLALCLKQPAVQKPEAARSSLPGTSNEYYAERDAAAHAVAKAAKEKALRMAKLPIYSSKVADLSALRKKISDGFLRGTVISKFGIFLETNSANKTNYARGVGAAKIEELCVGSELLREVKSEVSNSFSAEAAEESALRYWRAELRTTRWYNIRRGGKEAIISEIKKVQEAHDVKFGESSLKQEEFFKKAERERIEENVLANWKAALSNPRLKITAQTFKLSQARCNGFEPPLSTVSICEQAMKELNIAMPDFLRDEIAAYRAEVEEKNNKVKDLLLSAKEGCEVAPSTTPLSLVKLRRGVAAR